MTHHLRISGKAAFVAMVCFAVSQVEASTLREMIRQGSPYPTGIINQIEDTDAEKIVKGTGNTDLTRFEVGDSLKMHLDFVSITSADGTYQGTKLKSIIPAYPNYQFAAIGEFTITAIDNISGGLGDFSFDGSIDFYEVLDAEGTGTDINFAEGFAATNSKILSTTKIMSAGVVEADDFIVAYDAPVAFADIPTLADASVVDARFGLTVTMSDLGIIPNAMDSTASAEDGLTTTTHDLTGFSNSYATAGIPNAANPDAYDLATNTTINFAATVPEPANMLLWGGIAFAAALVSLRRRTA